MSRRYAMRARPTWLQRHLQVLNRRWRLSFVREGFDVRIVVDRVRSPAASRSGPESAPDARHSALPPMDSAQVIDALNALRQILDQHAASRAIWPPLALMERAMGKHGSAGIDRLSKDVLMDAAAVLDRLMDDWSDSGVIVLRARMEQVLCTVHGCPPTPVARRQAERPVDIQVREVSFTDFMTIDREWDDQLRADSLVDVPGGTPSAAAR